MLALTSYPELEKIVPEGTFPPDVIERAHRLLASNPGGSGAYSNSRGIPVICEDVAEAIGRRDGYPCDPKEIYLSNGASQSVQNILLMLSSQLVGYYLDEEKDWGLNMEELELRVKEAEAKNIRLKGMVIINPGNPTGMVGNGRDGDS